MARNYKELEIWKLSYELAIKFYKITNKFPQHEINNLTSQIRRASSSVPLNIAEGCSRRTKNSFLQFLTYAYGSLRELQVLLELIKDLNYINSEEYKELLEDLDKTSRKMFNFMKFVKKEKFFNWFK